MSIPSTIAAELRQRVTSGVLQPGDLLESSRLAAAQRGVSRGSVVSAYEQLVGEGYLVADNGGTRVNPQLPGATTTPVVATPASTGSDAPALLRPGVPDSLGLTSTTWRSAWRRAAAEPRAYPAPGNLRLRQQIAEHLRTTRSVVVDPSAVFITSGARDGLRQLLVAVPGRIAVEDPGYPMLHRVPRAMGREVVDTRVDAQGIRIDDLAAATPSVVLVMPNHQYPTGRQMSAARRFELLEWARSTGAIVVEDDYDSELRRAHPALVALDPGGQVAMLGSFAKTLSPAIGLGYVIVPERIRDQVAELATPVSGIVQDAMSNFLADDGVRRHTARMRRDYDRRRRIFAEVFPEGMAMDGGLHAVIEVADEASAVARARAAGFGVDGLGSYWSSTTRSGVVVGLGTHTDERLRELLLRLRALIGQQGPR
ncbi:PLP-dependent aminotransferase family protein [Corynebacterium doosanense]|uniref:GntR family transcriptional regulator n=1 Tax=Corynebacterium doosanense CAU 212 = DSM 45436 TaxID=558173 RepID=A0A097IHS5_9CORY|nr:PLP-dependent aminotransferase family protein [Corynebacterium doosanense]AIT61674.1 GntR family transcriptional regulator [Corynebacterium doosanense CAU 212 = DSM 45436]